MSSNAVFVRDMGELPISIATSLSLQALYNNHPDRKPEKQLPVLKADVLYINVRTLLRNIMTSTANEKIVEVKARDYLIALKDELTDIGNYLSNQENPIKVYFYLPTYDSLHKEFGSVADLREPTTDLQKQKLEIEKQVFSQLEQELKTLEPEKRYVNIIDMAIESSDRVKAFILTHYPVDLLYVKGFSKVYLLESHTGAIKDEREWYTKFHTDANERVPFNKAMLVFFGDSGGMFKPQHHKARKALLKIAEKYKWTYQTTRDKILLNLKLGGEGVIQQTVQKMFR